MHTRGQDKPPHLRVITKYKDDESNTRTDTVLMMLIGGGTKGGIHGTHMGPGAHIRFTVQDKKRQTIPSVEYHNTYTGVTRTYFATGATAQSVQALPIFEMQCVDCHNRAAHSFDDPDRAVDRGLSTGQIATGLPFIKKTGVELIKTAYQSDEEAGQKIPAGLADFYQQKYPAIFNQRRADIEAAGQALLSIYRGNIFADLKVAWGTYPNNLGHADYPGCFRCHDDAHSTAAKKTITQDCDTCHKALAIGCAT